ncbi:hypothetical protein [Enterobacter oligotrophicus]|uniref:hypothetical protein n=1 Tax=Enterobacter TaxID=547 RepID=UPI0028ABEEAD|nr:hypothetical protein [Enterobacter oligotrophicus]
MTLSTNNLKNKDLCFYLYMTAPLILPVAYYFTMNDKVSLAVFYVVALVLVYLDQKELVKAAVESEPQVAGSALGIIICPPIYAYGRAMKRWRWLAAYPETCEKSHLKVVGNEGGSGCHALGYSGWNSRWCASFVSQSVSQFCLIKPETHQRIVLE